MNSLPQSAYFVRSSHSVQLEEELARVDVLERQNEVTVLAFGEFQPLEFFRRSSLHRLRVHALAINRALTSTKDNHAGGDVGCF